jgi:hypothetical protein
MQAGTASGLLVLMGSLDWLTTVIGIVCFGAVESNPFLSELATTNLLGFTAIKLGVAFFVGFLFYAANKLFNRAENQYSKNANCVRLILRSAYVASMVFLLFAVLNNVWIVAAKTI